jgi:hypothetical protein
MDKFFNLLLTVSVASILCTGCDFDSKNEPTGIDYSLENKKLFHKDSSGTYCYAFNTDNKLKITTRDEFDVVEIIETTWSQNREKVGFEESSNNWTLMSISTNLLTVNVNGDSSEELHFQVADSFDEISLGLTSESLGCIEVIGVPDNDNDGIPNNIDSDDDNDGVIDAIDAFPFDQSETLDTDGDKIGNNLDDDDDGDHILDDQDQFPLDRTKSIELVPLKNNILASGSYHNCVLDSNGVTCWGKNEKGQIDVPDLISIPIAIASRGDHNCAIDENGIICWGNNYSGQTNVPNHLLNPIEIGVGLDFSCALDDNGVHCWGNNSFGQTSVPVLSNPTSISVAYGHSCAMDDSGAVCWGTDLGFNSADYTRAGAISVKVGARFSAFKLDESYGYSGRFSGTHGDDDFNWGLMNAHAVAGGIDHTCKLNVYGIACAGENSNGQTDVPLDIYTPSAITVGRKHSCTLNETEVLCWGDNEYGQIDVPLLVFDSPSSN